MSEKKQRRLRLSEREDSRARGDNRQVGKAHREPDLQVESMRD